LKYPDMMTLSLRAPCLQPIGYPGLIMLIALCLLPLPAFAALGGDVESIRADQAAFNAAPAIADKSGYSIYTLQTPAGLTVREYLAANGTVFAVAWEGPMLPDLKRLLGGYYARYTSAPRTHPGGHGHRGVHQDDLVVESGGHMRAFFGRAYLPKALPAGVAASEIQ
jgi:hypothetical protein